MESEIDKLVAEIEGTSQPQTQSKGQKKRNKKKSNFFITENKNEQANEAQPAQTQQAQPNLPVQEEAKIEIKSQVQNQSSFQDNSHLRTMKNHEENPNYKQTNPPSIPIQDQFPNNEYKPGLIQNYTSEKHAFRTTSEEMREKERLYSLDYENIRKAAEVHRQVRKWAMTQLKPGVNLFDLCEQTEEYVRKLLKSKGSESGLAFPCGCSVNYQAAHFTPNPMDRNIIVDYNDVVKFDFGTHVDGRIVDCAFTAA